MDTVTLGNTSIGPHFRSRRSYHYGERLTAIEAGAAKYGLHLDPLGSVVEVTGDAGPDCARTYDPWGEFNENGPCAADPKLAYTGHEYDQTSGLYNFGARYYDPATARFTTLDPYFGDTSTPPSLHKYLYAYANPYRWVDLEGYAAYFFAGTGNHPNGVDHSNGGKLHFSNIEKLNKSIKGKSFYAFGIGSGYDASGKRTNQGSLGLIIERGTGDTLEDRVDFMMIHLENQLKNNDKVVDVFGFSRGGAAALEFLNRIQDRITYGKENNIVNGLYSDINIRFVGLFDAVSSLHNGQHTTQEGSFPGSYEFGNDSFRLDPAPRFELPKGMKFSNTPVHLIALDEKRIEFRQLDVRGAEQIGVRGVHGDVGGGYGGNVFEKLTLAYMVQRMRAAGIEFDEDRLAEFLPDGWNASEFTYQTALPTNNSRLIYKEGTRRFPKGMKLFESVYRFEPY